MFLLTFYPKSFFTWTYLSSIPYRSFMKQYKEVPMKTHLFLLVAVFVILYGVPVVLAFEFNQTITPEQQATFDQILAPVMKIYNLVKYTATGIAALVLLFAGISYMTGGSDPKKRDNSKAMATYVLIGLVIIWAAPLVVQFIVS